MSTNKLDNAEPDLQVYNALNKWYSNIKHRCKEVKDCLIHIKRLN